MLGIRAVATKVSQRTMRALPYALGHRSQSTIDIPMIELGLVAPNLLGYFYQLGRSEREGEPPGMNLWKPIRALADAFAAHSLVENAANLYYGIGVAWAAYNMGIAETVSDKIGALLKAVILFPLGYLGVQLGLGYSDSLHLRDAQKIKHMMAPLQPLLTESSAGVSEELKPVLAQLKESAHQYISFFERVKREDPSWSFVKKLLKDDKPYLEGLKTMLARFEGAQNALLEKWPEWSKTALPKLSEPAQKTLQTLAQEVGTMKGYRIFRYLNPSLGYLLATFVAGPLLVNGLQKIFLPKAQPVETGTNHVPLILGPVFSLFQSSGSTHGGGH